MLVYQETISWPRWPPTALATKDPLIQDLPWLGRQRSPEQNQPTLVDGIHMCHHLSMPESMPFDHDLVNCFELVNLVSIRFSF